MIYDTYLELIKTHGLIYAYTWLGLTLDYWYVEDNEVVKLFKF